MNRYFYGGKKPLVDFELKIVDCLEVGNYFYLINIQIKISMFIKVKIPTKFTVYMLNTRIPGQS